MKRHRVSDIQIIFICVQKRIVNKDISFIFYLYLGTDLNSLVLCMSCVLHKTAMVLISSASSGRCSQARWASSMLSVIVWWMLTKGKKFIPLSLSPNNKAWCGGCVISDDATPPSPPTKFTGSPMKACMSRASEGRTSMPSFRAPVLTGSFGGLNLNTSSFLGVEGISIDEWLEDASEGARYGVPTV